MNIVHMSGFFKGVRRIGVKGGGNAVVVMLSRFSGREDEGEVGDGGVPAKSLGGCQLEADAELAEHVEGVDVVDVEVVAWVWMHSIFGNYVQCYPNGS